MRDRRADFLSRATLAACFVLIGYAFGAGCGRDERRPTEGWPAGIGGPKRPGGVVPPGLKDPPEPASAKRTEVDRESWERFAEFLRTGRLPPLRHADEAEPAMSGGM